MDVIELKLCDIQGRLFELFADSHRGDCLNYLLTANIVQKAL